MEDERPAYKSYEEMYQKEYHTVYSYIRRIISGNDAVVEDLTQEVFFVAYQKWERMLVHPNPTGFLIVVAQNKIKKWFREKKPLYVDDAQLLELLSENGRERDEKDDFFMVDLYSTVEKALSNAELDILRYYYEYGYSSAEMAGRLGITENCFKVRVSRMKAKLKKSVGFLFCLMAVILGTVFGPPMGQCQAAQVKPQYQVQVQASGLSYGQRLGESVLTGSVTDPQGRPVEGSFRWLKEDQLMKQVGTVFYTAVFEEQMQGDFSDASEEKEEKTKPVFFSVTVPVDVQKAVPDVEAPQISLLKSRVYDGDLLEEAVKPEGGSASWTSSPQSEDPDATPSLVEGRFVLKEPKKTLETGTCEFSVLFLPEQETLFEQVEVKGYSIKVQPRPVQMELFFLKEPVLTGKETSLTVSVNKEKGLSALNGSFSLFVDGQETVSNIVPDEKKDSWEAGISFVPAYAGTQKILVVYTPTDSHTAQSEAGREICVVSPLSAITGDNPAAGQKGQPYEEQIETDASGQFALTFSVAEGELPDGLLLDAASGVLKGTPQTAGSFSFTVAVSEEKTGGTARREYTLEILPAPQLDFSLTCSDIVYGETLRPRAESDLEDAAFSFSYEGLGKTSYARSSEPPAKPGRYRVIAKVTSPGQYAGQTREAEFEIRKAVPQLEAKAVPEELTGGGTAEVTVSVLNPSDPGQKEGLPDKLSIDVEGKVEKISGPTGGSREYRYELKLPNEDQKVLCTISTEENDCYRAASVSVSVLGKKKESPSSSDGKDRKPAVKEEKAQEEEIVPKTAQEVEAEFWQDVIFRIYRAQEEGGGTVTINAKGHGSMPDSVMEALRSHTEVALALVWEGDMILIPAGKAQAASKSFPSWTLGELSSRYPLQKAAASVPSDPAIAPAAPSLAPQPSLPAASSKPQPTKAPETNAGEEMTRGTETEETISEVPNTGPEETPSAPQSEIQETAQTDLPHTEEAKKQTDWFTVAAFLCAATGGLAIVIAAVAMKKKR